MTDFISTSSNNVIGQSKYTNVPLAICAMRGWNVHHMYGILSVEFVATKYCNYGNHIPTHST